MAAGAGWSLAQRVSRGRDNRALGPAGRWKQWAFLLHMKGRKHRKRTQNVSSEQVEGVFIYAHGETGGEARVWKVRNPTSNVAARGARDTPKWGCYIVELVTFRGSGTVQVRA